MNLIRLVQNTCKYAASLVLAFALVGCITVNLGGDSNKSSSDGTPKSKEVELANPLNVYRTSTNILTKVTVQNKRGKWVESEKEVLIPGGWYVVSGEGLEDSSTK